MSAGPRAPWGAGMIVSLSLLLAACGAPAAPPAHAPASDELRVGLTEWTIVTSPAVAATGLVELSITNTGATAHDLVVTGRRGTWATPLLEPGGTAHLQVETERGEVLELHCTVVGHAEQGMRIPLTVAAEGD